MNARAAKALRRAVKALFPDGRVAYETKNERIKGFGPVGFIELAKGYVQPFQVQVKTHTRVCAVKTQRGLYRRMKRDLKQLRLAGETR